MAIVWPVIVSVRHIVTTMSAQSSLSAGFFKSEVAAEFSICSRRRAPSSPAMILPASDATTSPACSTAGASSPAVSARAD